MLSNSAVARRAGLFLWSVVGEFYWAVVALAPFIRRITIELFLAAAGNANLVWNHSCSKEVNLLILNLYKRFRPQKLVILNVAFRRMPDCAVKDLYEPSPNRSFTFAGEAEASKLHSR